MAKGESYSIMVTVCNAPNNELAKTNKVFTSEAWAKNQVQYLRIKEIGSLSSYFVFSVEYNSIVEPKSLAMSGVQRKLVRASLKDEIEISAWNPPTNGFEISLLKAELELVAKNKIRPGSSMELDSLSVGIHILNNFSKQVLTNRQQFAFEYQGTNYLLSVVEISIKDKTGDQVLATAGMLSPKTTFFFEIPPGSNISLKGQKVAAPQLFKVKNLNFETLGIGGLDSQFAEIFRRAFQSRMLSPSLAEKLGVPHVKGMLLHGPPGTGKTLIARQIGKMLNAKEPKIVNGPEILNKYVGASEENVRELFKDAEKEQQEKGDSSDLHVIILDEIDAICKQRGSVGGGTGVHDTVVNQFLTKIDGVDALNNILLIGMTNRKDMLDDALLRPGRLEVQVEIGLPDEHGRLQILKIHTNKMTENSFLSQDVNLEDLAARTKNFSGAEIQGLVKSAISFGVNRHMDIGNASQIDEDAIKVTGADFDKAFSEVIPAFGAVTDTLESFRSGGIIPCGSEMEDLIHTCRDIVSEVAKSKSLNLYTMLLAGPRGSGKTAIAATLGIESQIPFVKVISSREMKGFSESAQIGQIEKIFQDAYKSPSSLIILDGIERLVEYINIGPRFSNALVQIILNNLTGEPPKGHKLIIVGTTRSPEVMESLEITHAFDQVFNVPMLTAPGIQQVFQQTNSFRTNNEIQMALSSLMMDEISIKRLLQLLTLSREGGQSSGPVDIYKWQEIVLKLQK